MTSLDAARHAAQTALLEFGAGLVFGTAGWTTLPDDLCGAVQDEGHPDWLDGGLTARVRRVDRGDEAVALKKARDVCRVRNRDGELSFLNELLRRAELQALAQQGQGIPGVVPTTFASLTQGVIVSPWIDGGPVHAWDERPLLQLFDTGVALILAGFFEWDFCPGNVLDDGQRLWLFDFGYMYRFDPLRQLNTAGNGLDCPQFHLAERFESRNFFGHLLLEEQAQGTDAAHRRFRLEKEIALEAYQRLHRDLAARGASTTVLDFWGGIASGWRQALRGDLSTLYLVEGWRSHEADLDDDLHGRSCTPMTLHRARWLQAQLEDHFDALRAGGAFHAGGSECTQEALHARLRSQHELAVAYQLQEPHSVAVATS